MTLDKARRILGITVQDLADNTCIPYIQMAKVLRGEIECPNSLEAKIKNFLIKNYTERIESIRRNGK